VRQEGEADFSCCNYRTTYSHLMSCNSASPNSIGSPLDQHVILRSYLRGCLIKTVPHPQIR